MMAGVDVPNVESLGVNPGSKSIVHTLMASIEYHTGITVSSAVERKLNKLFSGMPSATLWAWAKPLIEKGPLHTEWAGLIEGLTVHETYLFRHPGQLKHLYDNALLPLVTERKRQSSPLIKIWSAASSSGEELYSVAVLLFEALLSIGEASVVSDGRVVPNPRWRLELLGTDLSKAVLTIAREGVYIDQTLGSFRNIPKQYWCYFEHQFEKDSRTAKVYQVVPAIRRCVQFRQFNLLNPVPALFQADVILCRNVLIYFDESAKSRARSMLISALNSGAYLVLGPTDTIGKCKELEALWGPSDVMYKKTGTLV